MTQPARRTAWPLAAVDAAAAFCRESGGLPALLIGSDNGLDTAATIRQYSRLPADLLAEATATPWPDHSFLRIVAAIDAQEHVSEIHFAEWLRICRPQGRLLLVAANPHCWKPFRLPASTLISHPPQHYIHLAQAAGWHYWDTVYFSNLPKHRFCLSACLPLHWRAPLYAVHLQKQVYAVPPAKEQTAEENVVLGVLGMACNPAKAL